MSMHMSTCASIHLSLHMSTLFFILKVSDSTGSWHEESTLVAGLCIQHVFRQAAHTTITWWLVCAYTRGIDICVDICSDMCVGMRSGMCADMCADMSVDMCADMCAHMCADMSVDMCVDMCVDRLVPEKSISS